MKIDRQISHKALTDAFTLLYGEEFRETFNEVGNELIDLGYKNGKAYFKAKAFYEIKDNSPYIVHLMFPNTDRGETVESIKEKAHKQFSLYLTKKEIEQLFIEKDYKIKEEEYHGNFAYPKNMGKLEGKILKKIGKSLPKAQNLPSLYYFKDFPTYRTHHKEVNLYTEGGLGLDQFDRKSVKYYLEENESFYLNEAISRKYHAIGSLLAREEMKNELVEKIKSNFFEPEDRMAERGLTEMLMALCFDSEEDGVLLEIQKVYGEKRFMTPKQISESIARFAKTDEGKKRFEENKK